MKPLGRQTTRPFWPVFSVVFALLIFATACNQNPPTKWERPWNCWSHSLEAGYSCEEMKLSWPEWRQKNKTEITVAFACVSQEFDPEFDPYDFTCRPVPSGPAIKFDDDTMPRFHCVGKQDSNDQDTRQLACSPYWTLTPMALQRLGSGWFLWRSLESEGLERKGLFAVAQRLEADERIRMEAEWRATPSPTPDPKILDREVDEFLRKLDQHDRQLKARTPENIARNIADEEKAWRNGSIWGEQRPGSQSH